MHIENKCLLFLILTTSVTGRKHRGIDNLVQAQKTFLDDLEKRIENMEKLIESGTIRPRSTPIKNNEASTPTERSESNWLKSPAEVAFGSEQPKGFTNRQYAGTILENKYTLAGMCASRVHEGLMYYTTDGEEESEESDNHIHIIDTRRGAATVTRITLVDILNVDWEDLTCAPCDADGTGDCIYVGDIGHTGIGPVNVIYKLQEPEDIVDGKEIFVQAEDIEVISYDSDIRDSQAFMVSPNGRIFILKCDYDGDTHELHEIVDGRTVYLFRINLGTEDFCPRSADISSDGTGYLFKMVGEIYYWYVEEEEDLELVLTDVKQRMKLPYLQERRATSIAWRPDGRAYFTTSEGENEPLYRYDTIE